MRSSVESCGVLIIGNHLIFLREDCMNGTVAFRIPLKMQLLYNKKRHRPRYGKNAILEKSGK